MRTLVVARNLEVVFSRIHTVLLLVLLRFAGAALAQCPDGTPPPCARALPPANSVAVLAFDSRSRDSADRYLAEGFQDEISSRLGQLDRLTVIAPGVVRRLRGTDQMPVDRIGQALHARHVVLGGFQRAGGRLRVSVQLVRAQTGVQVWSRTYDTGGDALQIQADVSMRVALAILDRLQPDERSALIGSPTASPIAWDHFQRGNHYLATRTQVSLTSAITEYEASMVADPAFVPARGRMSYGMALVYFWGGTWRGLPRDSLLVTGLATADDAIRRDSSSSDSWMARGFWLAQRNAATYDGTREAFERAIRLDPRNAEAWHQYADILNNLGYVNEALVASRRALDLEPGRLITYIDRIWFLYLAGNLAEAIAMADSSLALEPRPIAYHLFVFTAARDTSRLRAAIEWYRRANQPRDAAYATAWLELARGDTGAARRAMPDRANDWILAAAGLTDRALTLLERYPADVRGWRFLYAPFYRPISTDPRFLALRSSWRPPGANPALPH